MNSTAPSAVAFTVAPRKPAWQTAMEGPTNREARKMAARRTSLLESSAAATAAGNDELAFDLDCDAWDIERDLNEYGFTLAGNPKR